MLDYSVFWRSIKADIREMQLSCSYAKNPKRILQALVSRNKLEVATNLKSTDIDLLALRFLSVQTTLCSSVVFRYR